MVLALVLAQLVLPGPPSKPLSPPGMVCMGECSDGPMVWRASPARGRLVVACDMTSDTCSDGRKITTVRATPVPCETSPGVWEMVPEDTGCYGVRGLEVWGATTSYLSYGAELDRSPWGGAATVTLDGSTYRVCAESGGAFLQQLRAEDGGVVRTAACRVRAGTSNSIRLLSADVSSGGVSFDYELTDEWQTVTATATVVEGGGIAGVRLHPARSGAGCVEVAGCWSVIGDTPGRACWGGEAPVHCDGEWVRMSTDGFPTKSGEIIITFRPGESNNSRYLFDTRDSGSTPSYGVGIYLTPSDGLVAVFCAGSCSNKNTSVTLIDGENHVRYRWSETRAEVWLNGDKVLDWEPSVTIEAHRSMVAIGSHASSKINHLNGSVSSFIVRSYE